MPAKVLFETTCQTFSIKDSLYQNPYLLSANLRSFLAFQIEVTIASVHNTTEPIVCSRNVKVVPDATLESVQDNLYDVVVLPGGYKGTEEFCKSELAAKVVKRHETNLRIIAAICAAPLVSGF